MFTHLSTTARKILAILIIAIIIWFFTLHWLLAVYHRSFPEPIPQAAIARRLERVLQVASKLPAKDLTPVLQDMQNRWLLIRITNKPLSRDHRYQQLSSQPLLKMLHQRRWRLLHLSFSLNNGQWLNVVLRQPHQRNSIKISFWLAIGLLFIMMLALCIWSVGKLSMPFTELARAVKQLNNDGAAVVPANSSQELQDTIEAVNTLQGRIQTLVRDRTQMLAAISHDLRTPITRLKLRAEYFEDTPQYEKMLQDCEEMEHMIQSVLTFAQNDYQQEAASKFDLIALLGSMVSDLEDVGYAISFETQLASLPYLGRLSAMKRALSNVLDNALKYGNQASCLLKIDAQNVVILVEDNGPGIPDNQLERVFEPFYRVEPSRSKLTGGTGLGLVVARDVIRAHGGEIELINLPKQGLRVLMTLPCA